MTGDGTHTLVFDLGKTHIKLHLLDSCDRTLAVREVGNRPLATGQYPAADVDRVWDWLLNSIRTLQGEFGVHQICVTTHGATAALVDPSLVGNGLVLPILDYEYSGVEEINADYDRLRPPFAETGSPALPAGLNLGRQLFWQAHAFPAEFAQVTRILLYPQYWVWRLTGHCISEVTSLGCHTDLWAPWRNGWSSLVARLGWHDRFPPLANAWDSAGPVLEAVRRFTGVPADCAVRVGLHDSNASYLRYKRALRDTDFAIVSTGTWSVVMNGRADASLLGERRDMLANVDVFGVPVVCSRFMGGREYGLVCEWLGGDPAVIANEAQVRQLLENSVFCLPAWQPDTGPFGTNTPEIPGQLPAGVPATALASLYCALMLDYQLDLVGAGQQLIMGGAFLKNPLLCRLLAQLRAGQPLLASNDITGTVMGAAQLAHWHRTAETLELNRISPATVAGLDDYRRQWRAFCESAQTTDN